MKSRPVLLKAHCVNYFDKMAHLFVPQNKRKTLHE